METRSCQMWTCRKSPGHFEIAWDGIDSLGRARRITCHGAQQTTNQWIMTCEGGGTTACITMTGCGRNKAMKSVRAMLSGWAYFINRHTSVSIKRRDNSAKGEAQ